MRKKVVSFISIFLLMFLTVSPIYANAEDGFHSMGNQELQYEGIKAMDAIMLNISEYSSKLIDVFMVPLSMESLLEGEIVDLVDDVIPGYSKVVDVYEIFTETVNIYSDYLKVTAKISPTIKKIVDVQKNNIETDLMYRGEIIASTYQLGIKHRGTNEPVPTSNLKNVDKGLKNKKLLNDIRESAEGRLIKFFSKKSRNQILKLAKSYEELIDNTPSLLSIYNLGRYGSEVEPTVVRKNLSDGLYSIREKGTNLSFDVTSYGTVKGTNLQLMPYSANTAQIFRIENVNGAIRIWSVCSPNLVIDIGGNDTSTRKTGINIDLWTLNVDYSKNYWKDQEWSVVYNVDGSYLIKPTHYSGLLVGKKGSNVELVNESDYNSITSWIVEPIILAEDNPRIAYLHSTENIGLRVRLTPNGERIGHLSEKLNKELTVLGEPVNGWYKVKGIDTATKRTIFGYSSTDYISVGNKNIRNNTLIQAGADKAITWAKGNLGSKRWNYYCTRFVSDAFQYAGVINRRFIDAKAAGDALSTYTDREPVYGAVVFYDWYGTVEGEYKNWGHVGIHIGNNQVIHAFGSGGVVISKGLDISGCTYRGWGIWK